MTLLKQFASGEATERKSPARSRRVALISMPFGPVDRPSIQCGLLAAELIARGHDVEIHQFDLELAAQFGPRLYGELAAQRSESHVGDWMFAVAAFGAGRDPQQFRAACPSIDEVCEQVGLDFPSICELRSAILPEFVRLRAALIEWSAFDVIGLTTTFEQQVASLAMARAIRPRAPDSLIVLGGANVTGEMGLEHLRAFEWVDAVALGEGDEVLPALVETFERGAASAGQRHGRGWPLPGMACRVNGEVRTGSAAPAVSLVGLPEPDYHAYFATLERVGSDRALGDKRPQLPIEGSRGCWWGERQTCGFCGLNGTSVSFRRKPAEQLRTEITRLAERYKRLDFEPVDRILDTEAIESVFERLAEQQVDYSFFHQVKANIKPEELARLAAVGVTELQPGIESLSTRLLRLMHKGTCLLENVRCMAWARHLGIQIGWNLLTGFPGEAQADYDAQAKLLPLLHHMQPPKICGRLWLERYSPYGRDCPESPFRNRRPREAYRFIYPETEVDLNKIAYFWDCDLEGAVPEHGLEILKQRVADWQALWHGPVQPWLETRRGVGWLHIEDGRDPTKLRDCVLEGREADFYAIASENFGSASRLAARSSSAGVPIDAEAAEVFLRRWCEQGLAIEDGGQYLALALPARRAGRSGAPAQKG